MSNIKVPYHSQLGREARYGVGDCGPACIAMLANYYGHPCTVDTVSKATGRNMGFTGIYWWELIKVGYEFGVKLTHKNLTLKALKQSLANKLPVIALVKYDSLPKRYDVAYKQAHWIVIVGYDELLKRFTYHDPYWPNNRGAFITIQENLFDIAWNLASPSHRGGRQALVLV